MNTPKKLDMRVLAWFAILAFLLVVLFAVAAFKDANPEWAQIQRNFQVEKMLAYEALSDRARAEGKEPPPPPNIQPVAINQVIIPELKNVDRCITCHTGIDSKAMEGMPQPFTAHPNLELINQYHPTDKFGCVSCHQGQGLATTTEAAHGFVHKWEYPMLGTPDNLTKYIDASCVQCHVNPADMQKVAPLVAKGAQIVKDKNCIQCHKIGREGTPVGPDLTYIGDKTNAVYSAGRLFEALKENVKAGKFEGVEPRTHIHEDVVTWHYYHFKNPPLVTPGSIMPNFGFTDDQIDALIAWTLAQKRPTMPAEYVTTKPVGAAFEPRPLPTPAATPAPKKLFTGPVTKEALMREGERLYNNTCASCHGQGGQGTPGVFPPLAGSEWVKDKNQQIDVILKGLSGPITVKGQNYTGVMPPFAQLSDEEVAAIATYERNSWGNNEGVVMPEDVKARR